MRSHALYLLAVCHRIGVHGVGPHKHNDWLSFELCVNGLPVIVDPGTYCYTGQPKLKALFRSTAYHNTVVVDGEEQLRFAPASFALDRPQGDIRVLHWTSDPRRDVLDAEHTGYGRLQRPVVHRRRFELDKQRDRAVITDSFAGEGGHRALWSLHLDVGLSCLLTDRGALVQDGGKPVVFITLPEGADASVHQAWVSPAYNRRYEAPCLQWESNIAQGTREQFEVIFTLPADTPGAK